MILDAAIKQMPLQPGPSCSAALLLGPFLHEQMDAVQLHAHA